MRSSRSRPSEGSRRAPLIAGAAMLAGGLLFGSPVLVVPGAALLGLVAISSGWALLAGRGARFSRSDLPATVVEGETFEVRHRVRTGALPLVGRLADPVLAE